MRVVAVIMLSVFFAGCSIIRKEPYRETCYFDLGQPPQQIHAEGVGVTIGAISAQSPYDDARMVFRMSDNQLKIDEFTRWSAAPPQLLRKRLILSNISIPSDKLKFCQCDLDAEILQFEADCEKKMAFITFAAVFSKSPQCVYLCEKYHEKVPIGERVTGESVAKAMSVAVDQAVAKLAKDISQLK